MENFNSVLSFTEGENGLLYNNVDGFIYTIENKNEQATVYVNLPEVSKNEKKMISAYLKEGILYYLKSRFVKDGIQISFDIQLFNDPEYLLQLMKQFSAYLISAGIEFSNNEIDVAFNKVLYAYLPVEKPIDEANKADNTQKEKLTLQKLYSKLSTQLVLIIIYLALALIYAFVSVFAIKVAGAVGYLFGWLPTTVLIKRKYSHKAVYCVSFIASFIVLLLTTGYVFLYYFLSQQDIYTASEFIMQSLTPSHCLFNMALAYLLAMFGTYSTVPAKKKKSQEEDDFS